LAAATTATLIAMHDIDDTIREVHGHQKLGAAFGYSWVRGLNAQFAGVSSPVARSGDRRGPAAGRQHRLGQGRWPAGS
jgi:hypothetical protein